MDDEGEVVMWGHEEVAEDPEAFTAALFAVALAAKEGPEAVRANIEDKGLTLEERLRQTRKEIEG